MKIVVYGIGGVGGYFGGKLANAGYNTTFIARGNHLKAIKENGLFVKSIYGDFHTAPSYATSDISEIKDPDLVILAIKTWQVEEIAQLLKPVIHNETIILPLQNGVNTPQKLLQTLPAQNILAGLCKIISFIEAPGKIWHKAFHPQVIFGELNNRKTARVQNLKNMFDNAGFDNFIPENIQLAQWQKFLFIATISGIGALTRMDIGISRTDKGVRNLMEQTAQEIKTLANAKGIPLTNKDIQNTFTAIDKQAPNTTASMQRDIMEGRPSELEDFNGYIVRESEALGIAAPVNSFIYTCLNPMEKMARK